METALAQSIIKMDLFFFVTTIAVVVIGLLFATLLWYCIRLVRGVLRVLQHVDTEVHENISEKN